MYYNITFGVPLMNCLFSDLGDVAADSVFDKKSGSFLEECLKALNFLESIAILANKNDDCGIKSNSKERLMYSKASGCLPRTVNIIQW